MSASSDWPWAKSYPASIDWQAAIPARPAFAAFDDAVRDYPDRVFTDFLGRTASFAATARLVAQAAHGLQQRGIVKGDRVGLMLPNCPAYIVLYLAALKIGATVVNFNPLYAAPQIADQVRDSGCKIVATVDVPAIYAKLKPLLGASDLTHIVVCRMAAMLPPLLGLLYRVAKRRDIANLPNDVHHADFDRLTGNDGAFTPAVIDPAADLAVLQYTGGTTGVPKGAMLSHANLSINAVQARLLFPGCVRGAEVMLGVIPFFHVFAMTAVLNVGMELAATIVMLPRFDLAQVIKTIAKKRPTLFPAVPTIYTAINHYKNLKRFDLRCIKYCFSGGAPLPVEVKRDFERLTGCVLVEGYGLSETSPVVSCNPVEGENKAGSIGLPAPGTVIEIVSLEDRTTVLPQGEAGEVCIRGPQVMMGYWRQPGETASVFDETKDGTRLHTGDVGFMDADGYTFIIDRIKDMIAAGGFKIYPRHVEEAIYQHAAVEECIVAGVPDPYRGQTVKAFIKLRDGAALSAPELLAFLKDRLSPMEMPKQIEFHDRPLPKTLIGKLSRKLMLEQTASL